MMEQMIRFGEEMLAVKQDNEQLRYDMTCLHLGHKKEIDYRGNSFQAIQQRLKQAIEALEWYADKENYKWKDGDSDDPFDMPFTEINNDGGTNARMSLQLIILRQEAKPESLKRTESDISK